MSPSPEDADLLRRYATEKSEAAFAKLVDRHINLVYASALRRVGGDAHLAEDVTQQVFVALATAAGSLVSRPVLVGWLHTTTRFQAAQVVRALRRRRAREQEVHAMNESEVPDPSRLADWERLRPVLDGALDELEDSDREAVLLRYFQARSYAEVGIGLGLTENAARMRVERALDKMHGLLGRRGVTSTVGALALALASEAAVTAPAGLGATVSGAVLSGTMVTSAAAGGLTLLAFMNTTKMVAGVAAVVAALAMGLAFKENTESKRTKEELTSVRNDRDRALARLHEVERALGEEKTRAQAAEEDTATLLAGIERANAATEALANAPVTEQTVQTRYKRAQDLARAGNWEAALPEFLWCYDVGMVRVDGFHGVRLSFLLSEIRRLGTHYPPALAALRERRDRAAKGMETTDDFRIPAEFAAINRTLGEEALTLATFNQLPPTDPRRQGLIGSVYDQLIATQRYADASAAMPYSQMTTRFTQLTRDLTVPPNAADAEQMKNSFRQMAIVSTAKNIEVLAGAGKLAEARDLMGKLTSYDGSSETKLILREHLTRAGHPELMPDPMP